MTKLTAPLMLAMVLAVPARAAPPPAPPEYVFTASQLLTKTSPTPVAEVMALFAEDVRVFESGEEVAGGRDSLARLEQARR